MRRPMFEGVRHRGMLHFDVSRMSHGTPARIDPFAVRAEFERAMPHERKTAVLHSYASVWVGRPALPKRVLHTGALSAHRLRIVAAQGRISADTTGATTRPTASQVVVRSTTEPDLSARALATTPAPSPADRARLLANVWTDFEVRNRSNTTRPILISPTSFSTSRPGRLEGDGQLPRRARMPLIVRAVVWCAARRPARARQSPRWSTRAAPGCSCHPGRSAAGDGACRLACGTS